MQLVIISILIVVFFGRLSLGTFERIGKMLLFKKLFNILKNEHAKVREQKQENVETVEPKTGRNLKKPDSIITNSVRVLLKEFSIFEISFFLSYFSRLFQIS